MCKAVNITVCRNVSIVEVKVKYREGEVNMQYIVEATEVYAEVKAKQH